MVNAISHRSTGIQRAIKTPVRVKNLLTGAELDTMGLWDTGATGSVITENAARQLGLTLVSMSKVNGVHGQETVPVYYVQLTLNNTQVSVNVRVTEGKAASFSMEGDADILIGMDVITLGDFSVSNYKGNTVMTFRLPSLTTIDYCLEVEEHNRCLKIHEINVKNHRPDKCACGSGRDYKNCHGKSLYHE